MDTISYYLWRERQPNTNTRSAVTFVAEKPFPPSLSPSLPPSLPLSLPPSLSPSLHSPVSLPSSKGSLFSYFLSMCVKSLSVHSLMLQSKYSVQIFFWNLLQVHHVCYPLNAFKFLKGLEENLPSWRLSTPTGSYHHYTVSQQLTLITCNIPNMEKGKLQAMPIDIAPIYWQAIPTLSTHCEVDGSPSS